MRYIGVDLHTNSLTACYLSDHGEEELRTFDLKELGQFQASLEGGDQ
jgi:transposase